MLDLNMPVMDGFELLDHLVQLPFINEIALVVLTSSMNTQDQAKAKQYPLIDYIEKPLTKEKIERMLNKYNMTMSDLSEKFSAHKPNLQ